LAIPSWVDSSATVTQPILTPKVWHAARRQAICDRYTTALSGAQGKNKGDTFYHTWYGRVAGDTGPIAEKSLVPQSNVTPTQVAITIDEYGRAFPWTAKFEDLARISIKTGLGKVLKNHYAETIDNLAGAAFVAAATKIIPTGTDAAPTITFESPLATDATRNIQAGDFIKIREGLEMTYFADPFPDGSYVTFLNSHGLKGLKESALWQNIQLYINQTKEQSGLTTGYIGKLDNFHIFGTNNTTVFPNLSGTGSENSLPPTQGVVFGPEAVFKATAKGFRIVPKIPTDYGRDKGIAWLWLGGYAQRYKLSTPYLSGCFHITSKS